LAVLTWSLVALSLTVVQAILAFFARTLVALPRAVAPANFGCFYPVAHHAATGSRTGLSGLCCPFDCRTATAAAQAFLAFSAYFLVALPRAVAQAILAFFARMLVALQWAVAPANFGCFYPVARHAAAGSRAGLSGLFRPFVRRAAATAAQAFLAFSAGFLVALPRAVAPANFGCFYPVARHAATGSLAGLSGLFCPFVLCAAAAAAQAFQASFTWWMVTLPPAVTLAFLAISGVFLPGPPKGDRVAECQQGWVGP
jgi:hypothetical protein